jgi:hypothetical protein
VWIGNVVSNPGVNPNLAPNLQSFDLNAAVSNFKWPQVWTTNVAIDQKLPHDVFGTLEVLYGKDINAVYVRNADLVKPLRLLPDGRPYYGGNAPFGSGLVNPNELNSMYPGEGRGVYTIDNTSEGYNYSITAQLRKAFENGLYTSVSYTYLEAKSNMKSTEIASVLWQGNPVKGNPNKPELSYSEFGIRNRITGLVSYKYAWSENSNTSIAGFFEIAEGNRFAGQGGNRYSFTYSGDVNGDGQGGNDLIYIPRNKDDIIFEQYGNVTVQEQKDKFEKFIEQDDYLKSHRGQIAERFGAINPWYSNIDVKILHEMSFIVGTQKHTFQLSGDILNFANLLSSSWGVRSVASAAATSPLEFKNKFDVATGMPVFNFKGTATKTYVDDFGLSSRWQIQIGLKYLFN